MTLQKNILKNKNKKRMLLSWSSVWLINTRFFFYKGMDRKNNVLFFNYMNGQQQIPVPYDSMLHTPPTNLYILTAKQEPSIPKS